MMPTKEVEKSHVVVSNNRANDAVTYPWVHVIWMGRIWREHASPSMARNACRAALVVSCGS